MSNGFQPNLEPSIQWVHILDAAGQLHNGYTSTTLYQNPNDCYTYLPASSFHPEHITKSVLFWG